MEVSLIYNVRFLKGFFFSSLVRLNNATDTFLSPLNELEYVKIYGSGDPPGRREGVVTHTVNFC
jgi:hypothetical protein